MSRSIQQLVLGQSPNTDLFATYLAAKKHTEHPLCGNEEGWGPLSPYRFDFTPCFLDIWILVVSAFGVLAGLGMIYWLYKKTDTQVVKRDWHFFAKLAVIVALVGTTVAQAAIQITRFPGFWYGDIRFWTTVVNILSIATVGYGQVLEHYRLRQPNGVALSFGFSSSLPMQ